MTTVRGKEVPEDLNWVEMEGEWDLPAAFKKLHDVAQKDAAASEELLIKRRDAQPRYSYPHSHFDVRVTTVDRRFDITAYSLWGDNDRHARARIIESRKEGKIHVELYVLPDASGPMEPAAGGFTLEPRISDHGKQVFALVEPTVMGAETEPTLLYPWQASRLVVDTLRRILQG